MLENTQRAVDRYTENIARLNGVSDVSKKFSVVPSVQQKVEKRIQESAALLKRINVQGVTAQEGEKLGLLVGAPIASTTDTKVKERETVDLTDLDPNRYFCSQTNFDTHLRYNKLDAWATTPNFQTMVRDANAQQQALDRIRVGFNGISRANTSDRTKNPNLEDVNKGWLQKYREQAPSRVVADGKAKGKIMIGGAGADYANIDALVYEAINSLIEPWYADNPDLVVLCGRDTMLDKYFPIVNRDNPPTESIAASLIISQKRMGNVSAMQVPFMPRGKMLVTMLSNLSIYWEISGRRRAIIDNPKRDQLEFFESSNEAYVIEDFGAGCLLENIVFAGAPGADDPAAPGAGQ
ncbi:P2 family phage major capsid protein [Burkholderia lata]|uniref:P2 family phage major capsid protein n=1 Tax=Burkholderia lata (strain ATCC 17760 / DSM 23089 / LMG 22485 / NCIMB 9086 / R18194 / 383) TaxID=482957 RepID=A0A6P2IDB7_BURL3|nr:MULTISPECIES: phage major capsid protein, P2 family [Burkholderia cepacia complex]VWB28944.1 P2 family phage major capsid protein [Burkholderia lata]VWB34417.1 P2 family phage major capsid protein [Burkholderia lata]VWC77843.1 P2 family phage major capsid protein [Burkholderia aenigmatica]